MVTHSQKKIVTKIPQKYPWVWKKYKFAIVLRLRNIMLVPENTRKSIAFSFTLVDSVLCLKIKYICSTFSLFICIFLLILGVVGNWNVALSHKVSKQILGKDRRKNRISLNHLYASMRQSEVNAVKNRKECIPGLNVNGKLKIALIIFSPSKLKVVYR